MSKNVNKKLIILIIPIMLVYLFWGINIENFTFLIYRRLPRLIIMLLTSFAIVSATGLFQIISKNSILTPDLLGYNNLFILIQTMITYFIGTLNPNFNNPVTNFLLTSSIMVILSTLIYQSLLYKTDHNILILLLTGTILNTFFRSLSSFFQLLLDPNEFSILQNKLVASINSTNNKIILIGGLLIIATIPWFIKNIYQMDVIALGEDEAVNLGVDVKKFNTKALLIIGLLMSVATALIGPIGFLGLIAMNIARNLNDSYQSIYQMLTAILIGMLLMIGTQLLVERILNFSINVSVLLNLIGGSYMIFLLLKER